LCGDWHTAENFCGYWHAKNSNKLCFAEWSKCSIWNIFLAV
jgi:hypothetical protein